MGINVNIGICFLIGDGNIVVEKEKIYLATFMNFCSLFGLSAEQRKGPWKRLVSVRTSAILQNLNGVRLSKRKRKWWRQNFEENSRPPLAAKMAIMDPKINILKHILKTLPQNFFHVRLLSLPQIVPLK